MLKRQRLLFHWSIAAMDLAFVVAAGCWGCLTALLGRLGIATPVDFPQWDTAQAVTLGALCTSWVLLATYGGLYRSRRTETLGTETGLILRLWLFAFALAQLTAGVLAGLQGGAPPAIELGALVFAPTAMMLVRLPLRVVLGAIRARGHNFRRALIIGNGWPATQVASSFHDNAHFGVKIVGTARFHSELGERGKTTLTREQRIRDFEELLADQPLDFVVVCPPGESTGEEVEDVFRLCDEAGIQCHLAPSFLDLTHLRPAITHFGRLPLLSFESAPYSLPARAIKRGMDLVSAGAALLAFAPIMPVLALLIRLHDGGPAFFTQVRVGRNGRQFRMFKFRTMSMGAESGRTGLAGENEVDGPVFKIRKDPRITPIGAFLRKYSLDELPQLFNVVRGEMSIVGPRPPIPAEVRQYEWWQRRRLTMKPGLTCIWQVHGRNQVSFERWVKMDLAYIDRWSPLLDIKLMLQTIRAVVRGTGC